MTYEEKLDKLITRIVEERRMTRKGHKTTISFTHGSFFKLPFIDVVKLCLQLQDDEKVIKIVNAYQPIDENDPYDAPTTTDYLDSDTIYVEVDTKFDSWYEKRLLEKKSNFDQLDYKNLVKIIDVALDIDQQLQISGSTKVEIESLPQVARFRDLFPGDSISTRKIYEQYRQEGATYLKNKGALSSLEIIDRDFGFGYMKMSVNLIPFNELLAKAKIEYSKRIGKPEKSNESQTPQEQRVPTTAPTWSDSFKWLSGKKYSFGQYGTIEFTSKDRLHILTTLVNKLGGWATVKELSGNKDDKYVRTTIKQIENRLPKETKEVIKIVPTTDDNLLPKPSGGAYRIRFIPKT